MFGIILMIVLTGSVSASLCKDSSGYYSECKPFNHRYVENTNSKSVGDVRPNPPVFKGSYGSYRHDMYRNGDYRPSYFFVDYPDYSPRSFGGGFYAGGWRGNNWGWGGSGWGNNWGWGGWNSWRGGGGWNNIRYNTYYPTYYSVPYFRSWFG